MIVLMGLLKGVLFGVIGGLLAAGVLWLFVWRKY